MSGLCLLVDSNQGTHIPMIFANMLAEAWDNCDAEDLEALKAGLDHDEYWDAWDMVLSNASCIDTDGNKWTLWQDGDLWAICTDLMDDEEYEEFFGEPREIV